MITKTNSTARPPDATRLRKEAAQTIEMLIGLLDDLDGDPDFEPSLGSAETAGQTQLRWSAGGTTDVELDDSDLEDGHDAEADPAELGIGDAGALQEITNGEPWLGAGEQIDQRHAWRAPESYFVEDAEKDAPGVTDAEIFRRHWRRKPGEQAALARATEATITALAAKIEKELPPVRHRGSDMIDLVRPSDGYRIGVPGLDSDAGRQLVAAGFIPSPRDMNLPVEARINVEGLPQRYAMIGVGSCLEPVYKHGAHFVFDASARPKPGDFVVIWRQPSCVQEGEPQAIIKRLVVDLRLGELVLVGGQRGVIVEQLNPPRKFEIPIGHIAALHRLDEAATAGQNCKAA